MTRIPIAARPPHPRFREAVAADAVLTARMRGERHEFRSRADLALQCARLALVSDAFLAQALYRAKARMQALGIPLLPRLAHRAAMQSAQVSIGDPVHVHPGVYLMHGQVVIDGFAVIHPDVTIAPFVTIGLKAGELRGPTIERGVSLGTGAKVIGPVTVGAFARVGANAVVVSDVEPHTTVAGVPARPLVDPAVGPSRKTRPDRRR